MFLPPDLNERARYFPQEAFAHPAKMHIGLLRLIVQKYTQPGDIVLDPMAGSGTTLLATQTGRHVICVELEEWMLPIQVRAWENIRMYGPELGHTLGWALLLRGDARALPLPEEACTAIITSPPYAGHVVQLAKPVRKNHHVPMWAIRVSDDYAPENRKWNIGAYRGKRYWEAMEQVYGECFRVLRRGGHLVLVLKGILAEGKYVDIPEQTREVCQRVGFTFVERWARRLYSLSFWRVLTKSRMGDGFPRELEYEYVFAFRK